MNSQIKKGAMEMTRKELVEMVGSEEQANYAMDIILKNLKSEFVRMCIKSEINQINEELASLEHQGIICTNNGTRNVDWNPNRYGDDMTPAYDANALLYNLNRTTSLIASR